MRNRYPQFEEAKRIVQDKGIKSQSEYYVQYKELGLPACPQRDYKKEGWVDWYDFFGKTPPSYPSYEEAKRIVQVNGIKSFSKYKSLYKDLGLPSNPDSFYADKGWVDAYDFFGKEAISYPTYEEAKRIVQGKGIKGFDDYRAHCKELGLSSSPHSLYKGRGWIDWYDFLGKEAPSYPSYEEAKRIVQENGIISMDEYNSSYKELGLPSSPHTFYKGEGWIDYYSFFGKDKKISPRERKSRILTKLSISPELLKDDAPLQLIYMLASQLDRELAKEIEKLLGISSSEERLKWVKGQLKDIKESTPSEARTSEPIIPDELPEMDLIADAYLVEDFDDYSKLESIIEEFDNLTDSLSDDLAEKVNTFMENYSHNAVNRELIKEVDGE